MTPEQYAAHQERVKTARTVRFNDEKSRQDEPRKGVKRAPKAKGPEIPEFLAGGLKSKPRKAWNYESRLAQQLEDAGIHGFFVDAPYIEGRGFRADILFPFPEHKLAVECQGEVHRVKKQFVADILKAQATILAGYRLLPIATSQIRDGTAVGIIKQALHPVMVGDIKATEIPF